MCVFQAKTITTAHNSAVFTDTINMKALVVSDTKTTFKTQLWLKYDILFINHKYLLLFVGVFPFSWVFFAFSSLDTS